METIHSLTKDNYTLVHNRYIDAFGIPKDALEVIKKEEDGILIHYPFCGDLKVTSSNYKDSISTVTDYTEDEYNAMLEKQIDNIESRNTRNT